MVLLQSKHFELSTNDVIEWLLYLQTPFVRYNGEDEVQLQAFSINATGVHITLVLNGQALNLDDITGYWHRRSRLSFRTPPTLAAQLQASLSKKHVKGLMGNFRAQYDSLGEYLNQKMTRIPAKLGDSRLSVINKLVALENAVACGIAVPDTIITGQRAEVARFKARKKGIITKSILDSAFLWDDEDTLVHYTESLHDEAIAALPENFALSLVQEMVDKKLELRVFYLRGTCYAMAIFSQQDHQTAVDFRKYNDHRPNRTVPYALPEVLVSRLQQLMQSLGLDTGSIDLILTHAGEYVFLEVNPVGQFGMVSHPCNYYIERDIAHYLSGHN